MEGLDSGLCSTDCARAVEMTVSNAKMQADTARTTLLSREVGTGFSLAGGLRTAQGAWVALPGRAIVP